MIRDKGTQFLLFLIFLLLSAMALASDADRDGLSDEIELQLGSSATHKDVFVHVDWLVVNGRSMKPRANFVQIVTSVFDAAPINNPDGTTGIRLHISMGRAINTTKETIGYSESTGYNWSDFEAIKNANMPFSRLGTHHYCLFANDLGDEFGNPSGISGYSRNNLNSFRSGASDFVVALGGPAWFNYPTAGEYKWTQVGTFLHELGHNLGLMHGGGDHVSFKPNHLSVMSYAYQVLGIPITSGQEHYYLYDYARVLPQKLNENAVCDFKGLGNPVHLGAITYGTRWWVSYDNDEYLEEFDAYVVDWNLDGQYNFCDQGYAQNLNLMFDDRLTILNGGTTEWNRLVFTGGLIGRPNQQKNLPVTTQMVCMKSSELAKPKIYSNKKVTRATYTDVLLDQR